MNSVAAELVARANRMNSKSVEFDMPQIIISFALLEIPGLECRDVFLEVLAKSCESCQALLYQTRQRRIWSKFFHTLHCWRSSQVSGRCREEATAHVEKDQCLGPLCPRMVLQARALILRCVVHSGMFASLGASCFCLMFFGCPLQTFEILDWDCAWFASQNMLKRWESFKHPASWLWSLYANYMLYM